MSESRFLWPCSLRGRPSVLWGPDLQRAGLSYAQQGFDVVRMSTSEIDDSLFQNHPQRYEKTIFTNIFYRIRICSFFIHLA